MIARGWTPTPPHDMWRQLVNALAAIDSIIKQEEDRLAHMSEPRYTGTMIAYQKSFIERMKVKRDDYRKELRKLDEGLTTDD